LKAFEAQYPATFGIGTRPRAEEMNIILFGFVFVLGLGEQEREREELREQSDEEVDVGEVVRC
jgi:hypothetical protein